MLCRRSFPVETNKTDPIDFLSLSLSLSLTHTHTHVRACTHTHTHTCACTHTFTYTHTHMHTQARAHACMHPLKVLLLHHNHVPPDVTKFPYYYGIGCFWIYGPEIWLKSEKEKQQQKIRFQIKLHMV